MKAWRRKNLFVSAVVLAALLMISLTVSFQTV